MEQKTATVLFVDISGSTRFFDRYGEEAGLAMVKRCFDLVVPEVEKRRGRIVKFMGDGFLAVFAECDDGVEATVSMHGALADGNATLPDAAKVRLHSGINFGPLVERDDGDVFGDAVNVAARVQAVAGPDQIYATEDIVKKLSPMVRNKVRRVGVFPLRGKDEEVEIYEVMWRQDGATVLFSRVVIREEALLSIFFAGSVVEMPLGKNQLTIGRVEGNDVIVDDASVSREHAEVIRRKGAIYLVDRSTNGTFLRPKIGKERHLHREEAPLEGSGEFSLGRPDGPAVEYKVS